jgi:hypothetical protein
LESKFDKYNKSNTIFEIENLKLDIETPLNENIYEFSNKFIKDNYFQYLNNIEDVKKIVKQIKILYEKNITDETIENLNQMFELYNKLLSSIKNEELKKEEDIIFNLLKVKLNALKVLHNKIIYSYINSLLIFVNSKEKILFNDNDSELDVNNKGSGKVGIIFQFYFDREKDEYTKTKEMYDLCESMLQLLKDESLKKKSLETLKKINISGISDGKRGTKKKSIKRSRSRRTCIKRKSIKRSRSMKRKSIKRSRSNKRKSMKRNKSIKRKSIKRSRSMKRKSIKRSRSNKRKSIKRSNK